MLLEFSVANFKSFKETVTFSMVAANISAKDKELDENNVFKIDKELSLLKSAAIYGANASGKSNFINALRFMKSFVLNSARETQITDKIAVENFMLDVASEREPTTFEIVFLIEGIQYRYGFKVNTERIVEEWLYYFPSRREATLFTRDAKGIHNNARRFKEGQGISIRTRPNALFLSVVAQFNGTIAEKILRWFTMLIILSGLDDSYSVGTVGMLDDDDTKDAAIQLLKEFDLGFDDVYVETRPISDEDIAPALLNLILDKLRDVELDGELARKDGKIQVTSVKTVHRKHGGQSDSYELFDLDKHESEGTKKLFALVTPLIDALKNGRVLIIDELDGRLHPLLTCKLIQLFNSKKSNSNKAQLIFTTHDTNLLDNKLFRRDQIWFAEKDRYSATHLYSLVEYKVRNDASFEKDYIQGKYGAIPFIGDVSKVFEDWHA